MMSTLGRIQHHADGDEPWIVARLPDLLQTVGHFLRLLFPVQIFLETNCRSGGQNDCDERRDQARRPWRLPFFLIAVTVAAGRLL